MFHIYCITTNENIVATEKYTYNSENGKIFISKDLIDGDIEIEASAIKIEYEIVFDANGGVFKDGENNIVISDIINFDLLNSEEGIEKM